MISFYPGPSRVYPRVKRYLTDAYKEGIMSINHRSEEFMQIARKAVALLREKLNIPASYSVYFVSSATECWEIIAQSLIGKESIHIYNGAFGKKWFDYTQRIRPGAKAFSFDMQRQPGSRELIFETGEVLCITQNETSNGTQVSHKLLRSIRQNNPHLIAVDATSSMGGISLDFTQADVWFASVQKCFGLPAGLGILVCSPEALNKAQQVDKRLYYNSLLFLDEMMQKWQTPYTPNVLDIYLLKRVLEGVKPIETVNKMIRSRYKKWESFFTQSSSRFAFLIENKVVRSSTVLALSAPDEIIRKVKIDAKNKGFLLGEGYGDLKSSSFRIANFPAIKRKEIFGLMSFLENYS